MTREPMTVLGEPLAEHYSTVLAHEHLSCDIRCWLDTSHAPTAHLAEEQVEDGNLAEVRSNPFACADNLVLDDPSLVSEELAQLAKAPGRHLVVELTLPDIGRDLVSISEISERSGVDVVFGCGRYIEESRPEEDLDLEPDDYRDEILSEFEGSPPTPAVIGEIGTGDPISEPERRALLGAAMAQAELEVPIYVHLHPWGRRGHEALDLVQEGGGSLSATVLCHLDPQIPGGLDYHRTLMDRGATISFDLWGDEMEYGEHSMPSDAQRIEALHELVGQGYGDRMVHSHDICTKTQLDRFGGPGFSHLPTRVGQMMAEAGLDQAEIQRQLAGNAFDLIKMRKGAPR